MPASYAFPGMDVHYHSWDHHSSSFPVTSSRVGTADQSLIPSVTQRAARTNADIPRPGSFVPPFLVSHGYDMWNHWQLICFFSNYYLSYLNVGFNCTSKRKVPLTFLFLIWVGVRGEGRRKY